MLSFSACSRFWSSLSIVSLVNLWIPFGKYSRRFCDKCRSVKFSSPLISSGISSSRFSDTSRHTRFRRFPISAGSRCSWLWSSQSSWSDGKLPRWGGSSSISLSPKSNLSSFVSLLIDSGRCLRRFSRSSSDSNCVKLWKKMKNVITVEENQINAKAIVTRWVKMRLNWCCRGSWMKVLDRKSILLLHLLIDLNTLIEFLPKQSSSRFV